MLLMFMILLPPGVLTEKYTSWILIHCRQHRDFLHSCIICDEPEVVLKQIHHALFDAVCLTFSDSDVVRSEGDAATRLTLVNELSAKIRKCVHGEDAPSLGRGHVSRKAPDLLVLNGALPRCDPESC
ncbi:hypothetical protein IRJ41_009920 [Triplophysa rosa]|uniref:Uncharacterized protein n=1 Tax=Triplophysa rosa TaxID=992332 RepID=A0A9W7WHF4_TRIRA|nr:hypothetical protein IRJ41_009920 [Triplophysa rosa]